MNNSVSIKTTTEIELMRNMVNDLKARPASKGQ